MPFNRPPRPARAAAPAPIGIPSPPGKPPKPHFSLASTLGPLVERLRLADAAVIMKVGRNLPKVRRAVEAAGLLSRAIYVERGTMEDERILPLVECTDPRGAYFGMVLIPGQGRQI